jgi:hypothetical protein
MCVGLGICLSRLIACTSDKGGSGETPDSSILDAGAPADVIGDEAQREATAEAAVDAGIADVVSEPPPNPCNEQTCGGACCGTQCVARTCVACDAGGTFCPFETQLVGSPGYCVPDCSSCTSSGASAPIPCFSCRVGIAKTSCAPTASACAQTPEAGACACTSGDAGECPGPSQVCQPGGQLCLTCGSAGTAGGACANGKACDQGLSTCR